MRIRAMAAGMAMLALCGGTALAQDDARRAAELDMFKRAIEIPTVKGRGKMDEMTAMLSAELRKAGIDNITIKKHNGTETLIARWPAVNPTKKPILQMAHMDVVEAKREDWKHDPFVFREEDGYYLGRGVNDNKKGMIAIVASMARLKRSGFQPNRDLYILFTGDEETDSEGARLAAEEWLKDVGFDFALNSDSGGGSLNADGTPVGFSIQLAEKVYADYRFIARNRGGHSSGPRPDNAIYQLAGALKALEEYRFPQQLNEVSRADLANEAENDKGLLGTLIKRWLADPKDNETADLIEAMKPGMTRTRCVPTMLSGGHAPNALPQTAEATVNCRIFPGADVDRIATTLKSIAGQHVAVEVIQAPESSPPSPIRADVLDAYKAAIRKRYPGAPVAPIMGAGATDGKFFRASGVPVYGVGASWGFAGISGGAHGLDEKAPVESFYQMIDIWEDMLRDLAG